MTGPAQQPSYRVIIETSLGDFVELNDFTSLKYGHSLNRGSVAEVTCPLNYDKITPEVKATRQSWLRVLRKDSPTASETLVWYGNLYESQYGGNDISATLTMRFEDVANMLDSRYVPKDYSVNVDTDQSDILWDIINDTQSLTGGDLGITRGIHPTSKDRKPTSELQNRKIKEVLESYSQLIDGVDWEITPTLKNEAIHIFNTYFTSSGARYHKGDFASTPIVYVVNNNGSNRLNNANGFDIVEKGKALANSVLMFGTIIEDTPLESLAEDTASITNQYGLFEDRANESSIKEQATLDDHAMELLDTLKEIPLVIRMNLIPHVNPRIGTYDVGDIFTIDFQYYQAVQFKSQYRLYAVQVSVDEKGEEKVDLELNLI